MTLLVSGNLGLCCGGGCDGDLEGTFLFARPGHWMYGLLLCFLHLGELLCVLLTLLAYLEPL